MKKNQLIILVISLLSIHTSCFLLKAFVPPFGIQQFRRYGKIQTIFDARSDPSGGIIAGAYWTHPSGKIQNYISFYISQDDRYLIVVDKGQEQVIAARFSSTGFVHIQGYNNFPMTEWPYDKNVPVLLTGKQVIKISNRVHLDVRTEQQWISNGVIQGSILIPIPDLQRRINELKGKTNIFVNCAGGIRARLGWSVLARFGINSTVLDQDFGNLAGLGFKIVPYQKSQ